MTPDWLGWLIAGLSAFSLLLIVALLWSRRSAGALRDEFQRRSAELRDELRRDSERLERELRDELTRASQGARQDLGGLRQALLHQAVEIARAQNEQIDGFRSQIAATQQALGDSMAQTTQSLSADARSARDAQDAALKRFTDALVDQLRLLGEGNDKRLVEVRATVESRLNAIQADNERKLEQMRATVDEKLHATLEQRLGESFRQVAERLEQVHKGLGEMQVLARDVGSLNRVLTNVRTRGIFGEVQLAGLIEQVFTHEQYATNVETVPGSGARVEFAIRLPGHGDAPMWLPIDAKFPREDYERLIEAHDRADPVAVDAAAKALELRLKLEARTIRAKYLAPPHTTDFGILFVPTEGLYAEALRRPGLVDGLQREHRIMLAGPTTLLATLTSLQMGFRTLALEQRSAEVWEVLGAVKTEFGRFGDVLAKTKRKLDEASHTIEQAERRTRAMQRELRTVEGLPDARTAELLPPTLEPDDVPQPVR
jgi:DNA recombination protein RmuC